MGRQRLTFTMALLEPCKCLLIFGLRNEHVLLLLWFDIMLLIQVYFALCIQNNCTLNCLVFVKFFISLVWNCASTGGIFFLISITCLGGSHLLCNKKFRKISMNYFAKMHCTGPTLICTRVVNSQWRTEKYCFVLFCFIPGEAFF